MSSKQHGKIVAFLGPDGAGKSTVLDLVQQKLIERDEDFCYRYFAPGFLKRYRPKDRGVVTTNPHAGRQYGAALILAKIVLMLVEFCGGVPRLRRQTRLGLFDRYIHDLLVDPRRYRLDHLRWWMRALLKAAPLPDLLVIVSAPPDVIQTRKQEVPLEETARQVAAYEALADRHLPNAVIIYNTTTPEAAAEAVLVRIEALR
jgi:thymidylate kinase